MTLSFDDFSLNVSMILSGLVIFWLPMRILTVLWVPNCIFFMFVFDFKWAKASADPRPHLAIVYLLSIMPSGGSLTLFMY